MADISNYNFYWGEAQVTDSSYITGNRTSSTSFNAPSHDLYDFLFPEWVKQGDCIYGGDRVIKENGESYLLKTQSQKETANGGSYDSYKARATFFGYPAKVLKTMVGLMSRKDDYFDFPSELEYLKTSAGYNGDSLQELGRKVKECVSAYGRAGLLAYVTSEGDIRFKKYNAFDIRDWIYIDGKLRAVLLDESDYRPRKGFDQKIDPRFMVVGVDKNDVYYQVIITEEKDIEKLKEFDFDNPKNTFPKGHSEPMYKGKKCSEVPFQFFNPSDNSHTPGMSPLDNLVNMALALYRNEADYRQALFMQGQATPVFTGFDETEIGNIFLGAEGGVQSDNAEASAKFLELSGNGLSEMRAANENLHKSCINEGLSLVVTSSEPESNAALMTRMDSKTASIAEIVEAYQAGLKELFRIITDWGGIKAEKLEIKCNKDFMRSEDVGQEIVNLVSAWNQGFPICIEDLHDLAKRDDLTSRSLEFILSSNESYGIKPMGQFQMFNKTLESQNKETNKTNGE